MAGDVALHLIDVLKELRFMQAFSKKSCFQDFVRRIPVRVISARAALAGAANYRLETLKRTEGQA
jgi:glucokinase